MKYYDKHTFVVCAYGESPYLEESILSVKRQSVKSKIIMTTSTPNDYIIELAFRHGIELFIRDGESNIKDDWNFAYNHAYTPYVTIVHQDDIYHPNYLKKIVKLIEGFEKKSRRTSGDGKTYFEHFSIAYTGYRPLKNGKFSRDINSFLRAILRGAMQLDRFAEDVTARKLSLAFGNSICCPTVTYNKAYLGSDIFTSDMNFNIDWDTFLKLACLPARFLYTPDVLAFYRVHEAATSKEFINDGKRYHEDLAMFEKFWPSWVAKLIMKFYVRAYDTYGK